MVVGTEAHATLYELVADWLKENPKELSVFALMRWSYEKSIAFPPVNWQKPMDVSCGTEKETGVSGAQPWSISGKARRGLADCL